MIPAFIGTLGAVLIVAVISAILDIWTAFCVARKDTGQAAVSMLRGDSNGSHKMKGLVLDL